jgi:hypothetical protein
VKELKVISRFQTMPSSNPMFTRMSGKGPVVHIGSRRTEQGESFNILDDIHKSIVENGYKVLVHDPLSMPSLQDEHFTMPEGKQIKVIISFDLKSTDDSLDDLTPKE